MIQIKVVLASLGPCVPSASEVSVSCKGTPHLKKNVFFRALPKLPLPPQIWQVLCIQKRERAEILLLCAEKLPLLESVQKYSYPGIRCPWILVQRAILGVCAEILIFGEIFTSGLCSQVPFMFSEL